jgi:hypothetical protein
VVALLRGQNTGTGSPVPYLLANATIPAELKLRDTTRNPVNIISIGNPSFVTPLPSDGQWCAPEQIGAATPAAAATPAGTPAFARGLWCGRERVRVETRILFEGQPRDVGWVLISVRPDQPGGGVYWRIQEVELL